MKKSLMSLTMLLAFSGAAQAEVNLNEVKDVEVLKEKIVHALSMGEETNTVVRDVKQLNDSDNYMITIVESGQPMTAMYIEDINSLVVNQSGDIFDLDSRKFINKAYQAEQIKPILKAIPEEDMLSYEKSEDKKEALYVFTDPTCPYCRRLHSEIEDYSNLGLEVKYLPFPRGGKAGPGYEMMVKAYCEEDKHAAFDKIKTDGQDFEMKTTVSKEQMVECAAFVDKYFQIGNQIGVAGTPAIFTEDGHQIGGYLEANQAKRAVETSKF